MGDALNLNWERPRYYSGDGVRQDTIRFSYDVELYAAREYKDREEMLKQKPIYTNRNLTQRSDSIGWSVLGEKVAKGDYLFLRVVPKSLNEESIHFLNDSLNTFDAAWPERISTILQVSQPDRHREHKPHRPVCRRLAWQRGDGR